MAETGEHHETETPGNDGDEATFETIPEADVEDDEDPTTGQDDQGDDDDDGELQDLAQVLTVTARRLASTRLGRKYSGAKASPAELKKRTTCAVCGEVGHWKGDPECKVSGDKGAASKHAPGKGAANTSQQTSNKGSQRPGKGQAHQALTVTHSDLGSYEVYSSEYGQAFQNSPYQVSVVFSAQMVPALGSQYVGYMVLDTACQRTCCGRTWAHQHFGLIERMGLTIGKALVHDNFQFGKGAPVAADFRAYLPITVGHHDPVLIGTGVVNANVPLLASNVLLKALGMILNLNNMTVKFASLGVTAHVVMLGGHLAVRISDFTPSAVSECAVLLQRDAWEDAPPEVLFGSGRQTRLTVPKDADSPAVLACSMEADCAQHPELQGSPLHVHGQGSSAWDIMGPPVAPRSHTAKAGPSLPGEPGDVPPLRDPALRECDRKVQPMQGMQQEMAVGRRPRAMGAQTLRRIFSLIGTAIALVGQYSESTSQDIGPFFDFPPSGAAQDDQANPGDLLRDFGMLGPLRELDDPCRDGTATQSSWLGRLVPGRGRHPVPQGRHRGPQEQYLPGPARTTSQRGPSGHGRGAGRHASGSRDTSLL